MHRKHHFILAMFMLTICIRGAVNAQDESFSMRAGLDVEYFSYDEPGVMTEEGMLYGVSGAIDIGGLHDSVLMHFSGSLVAGDLNYDGSVIYADGTESGLEVITPNVILNTRATVGFKLFDSGLIIRPYSGFGIRYLVDDLSQPAPDTGYRREQAYFYLPIGLQSIFRLTSGWRLECQAEYDYLLEGRNWSHDGVLDEGITFTQDTGDGFRVLVALASSDSNEWVFRVEPFFEYWNIADSDIVDGYMEPRNHSAMTGLRFSLQM